MFSHDASADVTGFDLRCIRFGHLQYIAERIGEHGSLQKKSFGSVNIARNISSEHFATREKQIINNSIYLTICLDNLFNDKRSVRHNSSELFFCIMISKTAAL